MRNILFLAIPLLISLGCEKENLSPSTEETDKLPVVEAYLAAGQAISLKISRQVSLESRADSAETTSLLIQGLQVAIETDNLTYLLSEEEPGLYESDSSLIVEANKRYRLCFEYEGSLISAETEIPKIPVDYKASRTNITFESNSFPPSIPDPITLSWSNSENDYYQIGVENIENNPSVLSLFGGSGDPADRPSISTPPQQINSYELTARDFIYSGTHQIVLYSVNIEYVTLTQTVSSSDAQSINTPYTNIEGGLGIFTGVGTDTLFIEATD